MPHHHTHSHGPHTGAHKTALTSVFAALALVVVKLATGAASGSLGVLAEALHSAVDLIAALLTLIAVRVAARPPDRRHPFGHGKAEHLAALAEAVLLMAAAAGVGFAAIRRLIHGTHVTNPAWWVFALMAVVIAIDITRTSASLRGAKAFHSPALAANALHFASDLFGSLAVLVGLALAAFGMHWGDSVAAIIVAIIVLIAAVRLMLHNAQVLMDVTPTDAESAARRAVRQLDQPITLRRLRIRRSADHFLCDIVIGVAATDHVAQGHALASMVERAVEQALPGSDVVVHVEPDLDSATLRDAVTAAALGVSGIHEVHNVYVLMVGDRPEVSLHLKIDADMSLARAHELADQVEDDIRRRVPEVRHIDVHIEPAMLHTLDADMIDPAPFRARIDDIVRASTGAPADALRVRMMPKGLTAFVTITTNADASLRDAHVIATDIEVAICRAIPDLVEVVVHTEPEAR